MSDGSEVVRLEQRTPFTMIDNPIIRALDDYVALGLYVDMLSWPPGWRLNLREMTRTHRQGRTVLTAASLELDFCPTPAGWVLVPVVNPRHAGNRADCA